jgi:hypothetical protein
VTPGHFAEVVEVGVILILAGLRSIGTEAQREISIDINEGQRAGSRILRDDIESKRGRRGERLCRRSSSAKL